MIWFRPKETEIEYLQRRNALQQIIIENSHRNNARLREVIAKLTLTKSRRSRDALLADAEGKLDLYCRRDLA